MASSLLLAALLVTPAVAFQAPAAARRTVALRASEEDLKAAILNAGPPEFNKLEGVAEVTEVPDGISFEPPVLAKVMGKYDGEYTLTVSEGEAAAGGHAIDVTVVPDSMTLEEFYAGFADAPAWVTVSPCAGKLERKGGEPTTLTVTAAPPADESFEGSLALTVVLPDDIDKCYKIDVACGSGIETSNFDQGSDENLD
jgi:hypothetical protein